MKSTTSQTVYDAGPLALDVIYREHFPYVRRTVHRLGVPEAHADDAAQEVFIIAHRRLRTFEGRSAIRTWLHGIARRVAKDHRRSSQRAQRRLLRVGDSEQPPRHAEPNTDRAWAAQALGRWLSGLDAGRRDVFVLAELQGMTAPEISARLGIGCNTVYSRLRLARQSFARELLAA